MSQGLKPNNTDNLGPLLLDVCVLLPCYNNLAGLAASLASIQYDETKLLVLLVDDGSQTPVTEEYIQQHLPRKYAFTLLALPQNQGITMALNAGLQWLQEHYQPVKYVARLDCGDTCHPERFYLQVAFLDQNAGVGLLGTWCQFQDPSSNVHYTYTTPTQHEDIMKEMHFRNVFIHPTIMFRRELLTKVGFYPLDFPLVEDYAFCYQLLQHQKGAILAQTLVTCELNPQGLSRRNRNKQLAGRARVVATFGASRPLKVLGWFKLKVLKCIPYHFLLQLKSRV